MVKKIEKLKKDFLKKSLSKRERKKQYLHFDHPVSPNSSITYATNPSEVIKHSFYPLILRIDKKPRYIKDINKVKLKERILYKAAHSDSAIFSWYTHLWSVKLEERINESELGAIVLAYRSIEGKSAHNHASDVFEHIKTSQKPISAICLDIEKFFDNFNHDQLSSKCEKILNRKFTKDEKKVLARVLKFSFVRESDLQQYINLKEDNRLCSPRNFRKHIVGNKLINENTNDHGIAQGNPLSALLSNIYLFDFDKLISEKASECGAVYKRYSDDIILTCSPEKVKYFEKLILTAIEKVLLTINSDKTVLRHFSKNRNGTTLCTNSKGKADRLQYLGLVFDGNNTLIRSSTLSRFYRKLRRGGNKYNKIQNKSSAKLSRKKLYLTHTHLGKNNFYSYARRVSNEVDNNKVLKQLKKHVQILSKEISS